jgi:hypothetical protein
MELTQLALSAALLLLVVVVVVRGEEPPLLLCRLPKLTSLSRGTS